MTHDKLLMEIQGGSQITKPAYMQSSPLVDLIKLIKNRFKTFQGGLLQDEM